MKVKSLLGTVSLFLTISVLTLGANSNPSIYSDQTILAGFQKRQFGSNPLRPQSPTVDVPQPSEKTQEMLEESDWIDKENLEQENPDFIIPEEVDEDEDFQLDSPLSFDDELDEDLYPFFSEEEMELAELENDDTEFSFDLSIFDDNEVIVQITDEDLLPLNETVFKHQKNLLTNERKSLSLNDHVLQEQENLALVNLETATPTLKKSNNSSFRMGDKTIQKTSPESGLRSESSELATAIGTIAENEAESVPLNATPRIHVWSKQKEEIAYADLESPSVEDCKTNAMPFPPEQLHQKERGSLFEIDDSQIFYSIDEEADLLNQHEYHQILLSDEEDDQDYEIITETPPNKNASLETKSDASKSKNIQQSPASNKNASFSKEPRNESPEDNPSIQITTPKEGEKPEEIIEVEPPKEPGEPDTYILKFKNSTMENYIDFVSQIVEKNFIFDPADLEFRVTIISNEPTTADEIMASLLQELRVRGLRLVEVGNNIIIHKSSTISSPATVITTDETAPPNVDIITQVFRLENADPTSLATIIRPMLSEQAVVEPLQNSGHLVVTGIRSNIERITKLINSLDSTDANLEVGQFQAINLPITDIIDIAEQMLIPIAKERPFVLTPLTSKNTVYIVSTPPILAKALEIFRRIDRGEAELPDTEFDTDGELLRGRGDGQEGWRPDQPFGSVQGTKFYIHKLQFRPGDQIQQALHAVATSIQEVQTTEFESNDLIATINSVQWIESTNSLIFTGTADTLKLIKELIDEIDTAVPQVLIEILVLEASLDDFLSFGVDWGTRFSENSSAGAQAFLSPGSPLTNALNSSVGGLSLDPSGLANIVGFNLGVIGRVISKDGCEFGTLGALVSALHQDQRIDILLNPKIVVEDNTPAEFFVGINTRFQTSSIANDFGNLVTSNFEFRDIGSTIKVTPLIGNNGIITLDIEQEISSLIGSPFATTGSITGTSVATDAIPITNTGIDLDAITGGLTNATDPFVNPLISDVGPTTRKSTTKTRIHMPDGYFLILSGQIRDEKEEIVTQVPCLGGIPFIGWFFKSKDDRIQKRNLMLFIRPTIVNIDRINMVTQRQQNIWIERKRDPKRWIYEVNEALEWLNIRDCYTDPERRPLRE